MRPLRTQGPNTACGTRPAQHPAHKTERAHCMTCGRGLEPARAAKGGRARFCSGCCMDAYDAGCPIYGTTIADYVTRPVATRPRPNSVTKRSRKRRSDAGKPRKRVLKAGSKARPLRLESAEWTPGPFTNSGSKNFQRNQGPLDPISETPSPSGPSGHMRPPSSIGFRGSAMSGWG
jgi:hypothetical protein